MISDKKIATAMSGKTARACDCCIRKRARWYCPADDAFLCQSCDGSVHSANPLAQRHKRVRLKTASLERADDYNQQPDFPSWQRGLTRKPRTPRGGKGQQSKSEDRNTTHVVVPELDATSSQDGETEEQLLYQVPIFDPFVASEFRSPSTGYDIDIHTRPLEELEGGSDVGKNTMFITSKSPMDEYMPSDMDLEEFAADVETLLGKGFDDESYAIEELGLLGCSPSKNNNEYIINENNNYSNNINGKVVKEEDEFGVNEGDIIRSCEIEGESNNNNSNNNNNNNNNNNVVMKDPLLFDLTFEYNDDKYSAAAAAKCKERQEEEEDEQKKAMMIEPCMVNELWKVKEDDEDEQMNKRRKMLLRLDYEAISEAWASQGSPWMNGQRPEINPDDCWPLCMGTCGKVHNNQGYGENNKNGGIIIGGDGGREARVLRYREKRRTRLFSKKIRYEVRKLNAEKRPRMKGRFVKRSTFAATTPS